MSDQANRFTGISQQEAMRDLNEQRQQAEAYLRRVEAARAHQPKAARQRKQFKLGFKRAFRLG